MERKYEDGIGVLYIGKGHEKFLRVASI